MIELISFNMFFLHYELGNHLDLDLGLGLEAREQDHAKTGDDVLGLPLVSVHKLLEKGRHGGWWLVVLVTVDLLKLRWNGNGCKNARG